MTIVRGLMCGLILASGGCMVVKRYETDPFARIQESEDFRQMTEERRRFWMDDQPSHLTGAPTTLTVANVLKAPARLYRVTATGLSFVCAVLAGEAVDVPAQAGENFAAVIDAAPHHMGHAVKPGATTWLLRPSPPSTSR